METEPLINKKATYYTVETYALFTNVDKSILWANIFLEKFGYKFVCIDLQELEKNFSDLFSLPKNFKSEMQVKFEGSDIIITKEFCEVLKTNHFFGFNALSNKQVIFLKRICNFEQEVIDNKVDLSPTIQVASELQTFVDNLIIQFRLFKTGNIACPLQFLISKDNRKVTSNYSSRPDKTFGHTIFKLTEKEIETLSEKFSSDFNANSLIELAINNFNLTYEISDLKTKYVTLMTCLESLFNQGTDQITHTISRHLALIISNSEKDFQANYYRIKKLYRYRSIIVHGDAVKENLTMMTDELQDMVRQAINYCLTLDDDKKQLFDRLNSLGFRNE